MTPAGLEGRYFTECLQCLYAPRWVRALILACTAFALGEILGNEAMSWLQSQHGYSIPFTNAHKMDSPAPDFVFGTLGGDELLLSDLKGNWVLLSFWATWCPSCIEALPGLELLQSETGDRGLVVVGAAVDDNPADVQDFYRDREAGITIAIDRGAVVARRYGTFRYPESYLIDTEGRLRVRFVGPQDWKSTNILRLLDSLESRSDRSLKNCPSFQ